MTTKCLDQQQLTPREFEHTMGMPPEGPKMVPIFLDFTQADSYTLDYQNMGARGFLSMVQSVFVDNADSGVALTVLVNSGLQRLIIGAGDQTYLPILCPNPVSMVFTSPGGSANVKVYLINFPLQAEVWGNDSYYAQFGPQASTAVETDLVGSVVDMAKFGGKGIRYTIFNAGPNTVNENFYAWNLPDRSDQAVQDSNSIATGTFVDENFNPTSAPFRFFRITIVDAVPGSHGTVNGAVYAV